MHKQSGFTLSETLITLIIIGVVAALTLPSLINTTGRKNLDAGLLKAYYTLNEALDLVKADTATLPKCYYGYNFETVSKDTSKNDFSDCSYFYTKFVKKINTAKVCDGGIGNCAYTGFDSSGGGCNFGSGAGAFVTSDGMLFVLRQANSPTFLVDVNGQKGPNKWGYDIYTLSIYGDGKGSGVEPGECMAVEDNGKTPEEVLKGTKD